MPLRPARPYLQSFARFATSQHLSTGLKMTACVLVPALILFEYNLLEKWMTLPLGSLCVGLSDAPGPVKYRRNGLLVTTALGMASVLLAGFSAPFPWLIVPELLTLGFCCTMAGVFGNRYNSIGLITLLVFIFHIDGVSTDISPLQHALLFGAGGLFYISLNLLGWRITPYLQVQQLLAENLATLAGYLRIKAGFYHEESDRNFLLNELIARQITIHQQQEDLRELIFRTRSLVNDATTKGRILTLVFLDSIDLFEIIMTTQQDYTQLHGDFEHIGILPAFQTLLLTQAEVLEQMSIDLPLNRRHSYATQLDEATKQATQDFMTLRQEKLNADTLELFIRLRQILYGLEDITQRLKRLDKALRYNKKLADSTPELAEKLDLEKFITGSGFRRELLKDNLSLQSGQFRHAIRISAALLVGYLLSQVVAIGHYYWILLTIVTIMKPSYSITKTRNWHRLLGTLAGVSAGFGAVYFIHDNGWLFGIMLVCMVLAYSFMRVQYLISTFGISIYVILSIHFVNAGATQIVLKDRIIDTFIGSAIAWIFSFFVLPHWEKQQMGSFIREMLRANEAYFKTVSGAFIDKKLALSNYKLARKQAMLALANMSDNFQRMTSEPKHQQQLLPYYQQFVNSSHLLTSYIASLAYHAQKSVETHASPHFAPFVARVEHQFLKAHRLWDDRLEIPVAPVPDDKGRMLNDKIDRLLRMRKANLNEQGEVMELALRRQLATLKSIADQFGVVETMVKDEVKLLSKMKQLEEGAVLS